MLKVLLPVDGSESATRATRTLIDTLGWFKEPPTIDLLTVHLPVPQFPNMAVVVSKDTIERYYADECAEMITASKKALDAVGAKYTMHRLIGPIAESIVEQSRQCGSDMIYMGTRGMTALSNMALGSVATKVLHLAHIPVVLVH